jgi:hypothetical protein
VLATLLAPLAGSHGNAGGAAAAVVLLWHGFGVAVADGEGFGCFAVLCRRELPDAVAVPAVGALIAFSARELAIELCWPVSAARAAPRMPVPVADVGPAVVLALDDGLGVGVGVGDPLGVVDPLGVGDPLGADELGSGLYCPGFGVFVHPDGEGEL